MSEFRIPPISTLIGSNPVNFFRVIAAGPAIAPRFYPKLFLTLLVILVSAPFHVWEYFYFRSKIRKFTFKKSPLFILGHWRSGTTYLHNLLCADPHAGYVTTFHSVFPNNLASQFIFKQFMKINMPEKRPSDNVKLGVDLPQEDEFALSNLTDKSFYHFFYFPSRYHEYYTTTIDRVNENKTPGWDITYRNLVIKALLNTHGRRAVLKNPVNTARISTMLRIFPEAKFIFIYRNPITVFLSTRKFFYELFPTLWFNEVDRPFIDAMIYDNFKRLMQDYDQLKGNIPPGNLLEVKFEDLESNPIRQCELIYEQLLGETFSVAGPAFQQYISLQKGYSKNKYHIARPLLDKIVSEWGDYMDRWGYSVPEELVVQEAS